MKISKRWIQIGSLLFAVLATIYAFQALTPGDKPSTVLRAKTDIPMGQVLVATDFEQVNLPPELSADYVQQLQPGGVALRSIFAGELVPRKSVSQSPNLNRVKITIAPERLPVSPLLAAESVELWSVRATRTDANVLSSSPKPAQTVGLLSPDAVILEKSSDGAAFGVSANTVDVLVSRIDLQGILEALANPDTQLVLVRNPSV
jgi:Flp pilus assembly protein CpaB